jgi:hypothetical protein
MDTPRPGLAEQAWSKLREIPPAVQRHWLRGTGVFLEPSLPTRAGLIGVTCVLVAMVCICLATWPRKPVVPASPTSAQSDLPATPAKSNLKDGRRAVIPLPPEPEPVKPARLEVPEEATPTLAKQEPMLPLPPAEEPPFASVPLPEFIIAMPHEEATTMSSTPINFGMQLFLLGWYLSNPTAAALGGEQNAGEAADRLQKIERQLADLKTQMEKLATDGGLKELKEKVEQNQKALELINNIPLQVNANTKKLDEQSKLAQQMAEDIRRLKVGGTQFGEELQRLSDEVAKLQEAMRNESRKAFAPSVTPSGPSVPVPGNSTIRLVNAWSTEMSVIVDNTSHRLQPGEVKNVPHKAGNFTYEVLSVQPPRSRTLIAGETFTIRIGGG